jgi:hypothetical protein
MRPRRRAASRPSLVTHDVAPPVFRQRQIQDQRALGVLPGCDALQHLDRDPALEQVVQDDQPLQQVAAEAVDLLNGQHVPVANVGQRLQQRGPVLGGELAADPLLEHLHQIQEPKSHNPDAERSS